MCYSLGIPSITIDWFQATLYTRVLVNVTKRMKNHPFCSTHLSISFWVIKKMISPLHSAPIQKFSEVFNFIVLPMLMERRAPPFCRGGGELVCFQPKMYIYLFVELSFFASSWYKPK